MPSISRRTKRSNTLWEGTKLEYTTHSRLQQVERVLQLQAMR
jgi:hypothetical protein